MKFISTLLSLILFSCTTSIETEEHIPDLNAIEAAEKDSVEVISPLPDTVVHDYELEHEAWEDFARIQDEWYDSIYWITLDTFDIEMDCGGCEYAYCDVVLVIEEGRLSSYDVVKEYVCHKEAPEGYIEMIMPFFEKYRFPKSLWNKRIQAKLGTGLKC